MAKFKSSLKSSYLFGFKNMIVFNVATVGRWEAHGSRYQGEKRSVLVQVCSKGNLLSETWFSICKICIMPALTVSWRKKGKPQIFRSGIALRDHFVLLMRGHRQKWVEKLAQGQVSREHIESLYLHLALTVKANIFVFITLVSPS